VNYQKLYDSIAAIGRQRGAKELLGFELHHVVPECMNGSDDESNKALLTFREHFVAHRVLTKIHPKHRGLHCAVWRMTNDGKHKVSSRVYEKARQNFIDNHHNKTPEGRARWLGEANPAHKLENREAASKRMTGKANPSNRPENHAKHQKAQCPCCFKVGQKLAISRWHFDNCLQHPDNLGQTRQQIKLDVTNCNKATI